MKATIFLRTYNEGDLLRKCLEGIFSQTSSTPFRVLLLDSESQDETHQTIKEFDLEAYVIPKSLFTYSAALNFGVSKCTTELFIPLSGHCVPYDEHWLEQLTSPFRTDESIGGAFSRQIPWSDVSQREKFQMSTVFPNSGFRLSNGELLRSIDAGAEPFQLLKFSNAASCMRTDLVRNFPFLDLPFAEDRAFSFHCLSAGKDIEYREKSQVYHSHTPSFSHFRNVAKNAGLARDLINQHVYAETGSQRMVETPSAIFSLAKVPLSLAFAFLQSVASLKIALDPKMSFQDYQRQVSFLFASVGTTLGKYEAVCKSSSATSTKLQPADASALLREARQIQ